MPKAVHDAIPMDRDPASSPILHQNSSQAARSSRPQLCINKNKGKTYTNFTRIFNCICSESRSKKKKHNNQLQQQQWHPILELFPGDSKSGTRLPPAAPIGQRPEPPQPLPLFLQQEQSSSSCPYDWENKYPDQLASNETFLLLLLSSNEEASKKKQWRRRRFRPPVTQLEEDSVRSEKEDDGATTYLPFFFPYPLCSRSISRRRKKTTTCNRSPPSSAPSSRHLLQPQQKKKNVRKKTTFSRCHHPLQAPIDPPATTIQADGGSPTISLTGGIEGSVPFISFGSAIIIKGLACNNNPTSPPLPTSSMVSSETILKPSSTLPAPPSCFSAHVLFHYLLSGQLGLFPDT